MNYDQISTAAIPQGSALAPVAAGERLSSVDILRGFALLGILLMNIIGFGFPWNGHADLADGKSLTDPNLAVWLVTSVLFEGKMRATFSMLFGAGIVLFSLRAEERQGTASGSAVFYRRCLWLLALGFLHYNLLWRGDILYEYAVGAFILFPLRHKAAKTLLLAGACLLLISSLRNLPNSWELERKRVAAVEANAAQAAGHELSAEQKDAQAEWAAQMRLRKPNETQIAKEIADHQKGYWSIFLMRQRQTWSAFVSSWDTAGMMLAGMGLMKLGIFSAAYRRSFYAWLMLLGYTAGFLINGYTAYRTIQSNFEPINMWWTLSTYDAGRLTMALGHIGLLTLIFQTGWLRWLTSPLAAVGEQLPDDELDLHDHLLRLRRWSVRQARALSALLRGPGRLDFPTDRQPHMATLLPVRPGGVAVAFVDLLETPTDAAAGAGAGGAGGVAWSSDVLIARAGQVSACTRTSVNAPRPSRPCGLRQCASRLRRAYGPPLARVHG